MLRLAILAGILLAVLPLAANANEDSAPFKPVWIDVEGWQVGVDPALRSGPHADLGKRALSMLRNHLQRVAIVMPEAVLETLRTIRIRLDHQHRGLKAMQYHPNAGWLRSHGYDPTLAKCVHLPQAAALLDREQYLKHPACVLHELAHAYHDQVLGFDHPEIRAAFQQAQADGRYERVLLYTGRQVRHYGLTNHKEYFAEATEAYFYRNDFYPFVRAELAQHDPRMEQLLGELWQDRNATEKTKRPATTAQPDNRDSSAG